MKKTYTMPCVDELTLRTEERVALTVCTSNPAVFYLSGPRDYSVLLCELINPTGEDPDKCLHDIQGPNT